MRATLVLGAFAVGILVLAGLQNAQAQVPVVEPAWPPRRIDVTYELQYDNASGCPHPAGTDPPEILKITTNRLNSGQQIMEIAANVDNRYRFSAQYFSVSLGYSITTIDGVESTVPNTNCFWRLFVGTEFGVSSSPVGITNWIPFPDSKIIWRYTTFGPH